MMLKLKKQRGFTLVELMIVVAIIGILAALAVYGVRRYITSTKTAEAREILGRIGKDAVAAHSREQMAGTLLAAGATAAAVNRFCPTAAKLPTDTPSNEKVQTAPGDWQADEGWKCLRFSVNDPTYYSYEYVLTDASNFEARAWGNLDGDSDDTVFLYRGGLLDGVARLAPTILEPEDEANTLNEDDDEL